MALSKREWIYVGGAVGAVLILRARKPGSTGPLSALAKKLAPPKAAPRPTTTNLATGYGTRTVPSGPSSGIGFNPRTGAPAGSTRAPLSPTQAGVLTGILAGIPILGKLLNKSPSGPPSSAQTPRQQGSPSPSSGGGGTGGTTGGQGTTGRPGGVSNGGMIANSPTPYGFYDGNGNWVQTDIGGNIASDSTGNYPGYYNEQGGYTPYLGTATSSPGGGLQADVPNVGPSGLIADALAGGVNDGDNDPALESGYDVGTGWVDNETGQYYDYSTGQWTGADEANAPTDVQVTEPPQGGDYIDDYGNYVSPGDAVAVAPDDAFGYDDGYGYTDYSTGEYYPYEGSGGEDTYGNGAWYDE